MTLVKMKTKEDFQLEIDQKFGKSYKVIYSHGGVRGTMKVHHDCGASWECTPRSINDSKRTAHSFCPICARKEIKTSRREKAVTRNIRYWTDELDLDKDVSIVDYTISDKGTCNIVFSCSSCKHMFTYNTKRVPQVVKCKKCSSALLMLKQRLPKDLEIVNYNKENRDYITIRHNSSNCNYAEFTTRLDVYMSKEPRCYVCERMRRELVSKPVRELSDYFDERNIAYKREVVLPNCINPRTGYPLRFDFEVETPNGLKYIEYDGEQHFYQVQGWGDLATTQFRDSVKNKFCKTHGLPLLRVPYTEYKNMYSLVDEFIN